MIAQKTAYDIWIAYDEIKKSEKLISELEESILRSEPLNLRDAFGRQRNLQLGIPSGENGHRLYDVAPKLALSVVRSHIAECRKKLTDANEFARIELDAANLEASKDEIARG